MASTKCLLLRKDKQFSQLVMLEDMIIVRFLQKKMYKPKQSIPHNCPFINYLQI